MKKRIFATLSVLVLLAVSLLPVYAAGENDGTEIGTEDVAVLTVNETEDNPDTESPEENTAPTPKVTSTTSGVPTVSKKAAAATEAEKPSFFSKVARSFEKTFIKEDRWLLFTRGLGNTLLIALCSTLIGIFIGMVVALVKVYHAQVAYPGVISKVLNFICGIYTTLIRGTPAVVQLFIAYYIIFKSTDNYVLVSIFAFGINSGAYVSEVIRAGILAVDRGQLEAGRSLGLSHMQSMLYIVLPQAFKNILPALGNEFILLLKDTSIAGYIGTLELMKAGNIVRSRTFEPYFSLLSVAAVYLVLVIGLEQVLKSVERRLAKSDRH